MTGVQIEYLLGLYFLVTSVTLEGSTSKITADLFRMLAAIILLVLAVTGKAFI